MLASRYSNMHSMASLFVLVFLLICLVATMYVNPYHSHDLNKIDALSTFVQIVTIYAGLFVSDP